MPTIDCIVDVELTKSFRGEQLSALFDVPAQDKCHLKWKGELPIEDFEWNVGLICGPSGSGKSVIGNHLWPEQLVSELVWDGAAVIDDFPAELSTETISAICQAVGFNTIPAWLRPFRVLSNGERFRVILARRLLQNFSPIVMDEFTSVVDRQVAQIGAHATQKYIRRKNKQFVAISCHSDIIDWLQPDWILETPALKFTRRLLQRRPELEIHICCVPYAYWHLFSPYHYLTAKLHKGARCFGLFVGNRIASFAGVLPQPGRKPNIFSISRVVTLPDWQGLGLAFVLIETIGAAKRAVGKWLHNHPAHPAFIRAHDRSPNWQMRRRPGMQTLISGRVNVKKYKTSKLPINQSRQSATFRYLGPRMDDVAYAKAFLAGAAE